MTLLFDLHKALYFRFKSVMVLIEGESEITHVSSILLLTLFQLCLIFLFILVSNYVGTPFADFSGDFEGKIIAAMSTLMLVIINLATLREKKLYGNSIFIRGKKPTFVTDSFIVLVIFSMVIFSYLNDQL